MAKERKFGVTILGAAIFISLEIAAFNMLGHSGSIQEIWLSRASHVVMGKLWKSSEKVVSFFRLRKENDALALENIKLNEELLAYREFLEAHGIPEIPDSLRSRDFSYIPAEIVKISKNRQHNYFIINKGSEDGIIPQSGVIVSDGVIGIIDAVDLHYSYGLSLMNTNVSISAKIGSEGALGPLSWDGISMNGAKLKEIPLQYKFEQNDTVWTSGFSSLFPADIPLGYAGETKIINGAIYEISVTLFRDLNTVRHVTVVVNNGRDEMLYLESIEDFGE